MLIKRLLISVLLVALLAGCGSSGNLSIDTLTFASDVTKTGEFTPITDTQFTKDQKVFIMTIADGFSSEMLDDSENRWSSWPILDIQLRNKDGRLLDSSQPYFEIVETVAKKTSYMLPAEVSITAEPGEYSFDITVEDGVTGERVIREIRFEVVSED